MRVWVIEFLLDLLGYGTARRLVPIASLGTMAVERWSDTKGGFNWIGIKRGTDGGYLFSSVMASLLGGLFWFVVLALALAVWRIT